MFGLNLAAWRQGPWASTHLPAAELDDLATALAELAAAPAGRTGDIEWTHRQLAWEPAP
jgi:uncharacterized protein YbjT (DUF2867 family)